MFTLNTTPQFIHRRERLFGASGDLARELNANPLLTNVILNWGMFQGTLYNACNRFGVDRVLEEVKRIRILNHVYSKGAYLHESFYRWGREAEIRACRPQPVPVAVDTFTITTPVAVTPVEAIDAPAPPPPTPDATVAPKQVAPAKPFKARALPPVETPAYVPPPPIKHQELPAWLKPPQVIAGKVTTARVAKPVAPTPPPPQPNAAVPKGPENPFRRALQVKPQGISLTAPRHPWHYDPAGVGFSVAALAVPAPNTMHPLDAARGEPPGGT